MTRDELIKQCRYYNGEEKNPYEEDNTELGSKRFFFWIAEESYVSSGGVDKNDKSLLKSLGLSSIPKDVPTSLLSRLFFVFSHGSDIEPSSLADKFEDNVLPTYLARPLQKQSH